MNTLFVAWQNPATREWAPVARLTREEDRFHFVYTKGAEREGFVPFGRLNNLKREYVSETLFPLFANRLLTRSRPEYAAYLAWLGLSQTNHDVLDELARTGGLRATDQLELIPCPGPSTDQGYEVFFFARGLRHLRQTNQEDCLGLQPGEQLYLARDIQNEQDKHALLLRTREPVTMAGYAPRYYAEEFGRLMSMLPVTDLDVRIEQVNRDAPIQYRLLCHLKAPWPDGFRPCAQEAYEPLVTH